MLRPFCKISIQQVYPFSYTDKDGIVVTIPREKLLELDFVTSYEIESGWESHTNCCKITFPKNILLKNGNALFKEAGSYNVILGGTTNQNYDGSENTYEPLILKGDIVTIQDGYWYRNQNGKDIQVGNTPFIGYVSNVKSDTPIEIECEDNFYLLKRVPFDKNKWSGNLYELMKHIIELVNAQFYDKNKLFPQLSFSEIPNSISAEFSLGYLDIGDMTCSMLLDKLKTQYHFESTFKDNSLLFGVTIYDETVAKSLAFYSFGDIYLNGNLKTSANIFPNHNLEYCNKGDVILSTVVQCKIITPIAGKLTKDGYQSTQKTKLKILVYWDIPTATFKYLDLSKPNTKTPPNQDGGERHTCYYPVDSSKPFPKIQDLVNLGIEQLQKYYYIGFRGSFTSFGFPFVDWNDNIFILSPMYADRNGCYKVKKVKRTFDSKVPGGGLSNEIFIDYLQQDVVLGKQIVRQIPTNTTSIYII